MALLKIARLGHPILRQGGVPVEEGAWDAAEFQRFLDDLVDTMRDADGVGIAAPQVHVPSQVLAVEVDPCNPRYPGQSNVPLTILLNPRVLEYSSDSDEGWEGCLSVPDFRGRVSRWTFLQVSGLDRFGKPVTLGAQGFFARVLQHEIDHLQGKVFLDRLPDLSTLTYLREYQKYWSP